MENRLYRELKTLALEEIDKRKCCKFDGININVTEEVYQDIMNKPLIQVVIKN